MKKLLTTCVVAVGLLMPLAFTSTAQAEPEHHREIHAALHSLKIARDHLQDAHHDFGGHRDAALRACDAAIEQLRIALQYDD